MRRAYGYTLLAVVLWTTGPVGSKAALKATGEGGALTPLEVAFWGVLVGWAALLAVVAARGRLGRLRDISGRGWLIAGAMGLFGWVGYPVAINLAYTRLPLPDVMVIGYLNPVFVTLLQGAAFGRVVRVVSGWEQAGEREARPSVLRTGAGLVLCLFGVVFIASQGSFNTVSGMRLNAGALAALLAAFSWGVYSNLGRFVGAKQGREARGGGDVQNLAAMAVGLVVMGAGLAASGGPRAPLGYLTKLWLGGMGPAEVEAWGVIAVMGVLNYGAGYTLWLAALEEGTRLGEGHKLPPLTYLVLVFVVAVGWLVLRESFGRGFWEGAGLIAAGNVVSVWPGRRTERAGVWYK